MATAPLQSQSFEVPQRRRISAQSIYQRLGWSVIPVDCATKGALIPWREYTARHADTMEMAEWTRRFPAAGIAVVCGAVSGLLVLDADGADGVAEARRRGLPRTPMVATPSGGLHTYFRAPAGHHFRNGAKMGESKKIDVRSDGGYVVAPNTKRPDGVRYEWINHPGVTSLAEAPSWFLAMLVDAGRAPSCDPLSVTAIGNRNWEPERQSGVRLKAGGGDRQGLTEGLVSRLSAADQELVRDGVTKGERSEVDLRICTALILLGASFAEIEEVFWAYPIGEKYLEPGNGTRYLERTAGLAFERVKTVRVKYADLREYEGGGKRLHLALDIDGEGRFVRTGLTIPTPGATELAIRWQHLFAAAGVRLPGVTKDDLEKGARALIGKKMRILMSEKREVNPVVGFFKI